MGLWQSWQRPATFIHSLWIDLDKSQRMKKRFSFDCGANFMDGSEMRCLSGTRWRLYVEHMVPWLESSYYMSEWFSLPLHHRMKCFLLSYHSVPTCTFIAGLMFGRAMSQLFHRFWFWRVICSQWGKLCPEILLINTLCSSSTLLSQYRFIEAGANVFPHKLTSFVVSREVKLNTDTKKEQGKTG